MSRFSRRLCPECKGEKVHYGIGCGPNGCRPMSIPCMFCDGHGDVDEQRIAWRFEGKRLQDWRKALGRTLREEAKRRGIKAYELSNMEFGRVRPMWPVEMR